MTTSSAFTLFGNCDGQELRWENSLELSFLLILGLIIGKVIWVFQEGLCAIHGLETSFTAPYYHHHNVQVLAASPLTTHTGSSQSRFNMSSQPSSPYRTLCSRPNSPLARSRPQSPSLSNLTHMATIR